MLNFVAGSFWDAPGLFWHSSGLGSSPASELVLFHHISDAESAFTKGTREAIVARKQFEVALKFITRHYTPVRLQDVIADRDSGRLPIQAGTVDFR